MRNILVITVGTTPQIVTETVHALLTRREEPFVPDEIHLVTTTQSAGVCEALAGAGGKLRELYALLGHEQRFVMPEVDPVVDDDGKAVADVRTEREAIAFGNTVTRLIAQFDLRSDVKVHVSLAGGRKTMGWYAGAALSIFGRDQDELSHVLVEPAELEQCADFWWPTARDHWVEHKFLKEQDGTPKRFNARKARIDLALIPFVRLAPILSEAAFPQGKVDYAAVVNTVRESLAAYKVRIVLDDRVLIVGRQRLRLQQRQLAFYALAAVARKMKWPPSRSTRLPPEHYYGWMTLHDFGDADGRYLRQYYRLLAACYRGAGESPDERLDKARKELQADYDGFLRREFGNVKSKILGPAGILKTAIANPIIRRRIDIDSETGPDGTDRFGLLLLPHQIEVVESE
jgi:CRISPR-associated protein (TIGR02584 family)